MPEHTKPTITFGTLGGPEKGKCRLMVTCFDTSFGPFVKNELSNITGVEIVYPTEASTAHVIVVNLAVGAPLGAMAHSIAEVIANDACWSDDDYSHNIDKL